MTTKKNVLTVPVSVDSYSFPSRAIPDSDLMNEMQLTLSRNRTISMPTILSSTKKYLNSLKELLDQRPVMRGTSETALPFFMQDGRRLSMNRGDTLRNSIVAVMSNPDSSRIGLLEINSLDATARTDRAKENKKTDEHQKETEKEKTDSSPTQAEDTNSYAEQERIQEELRIMFNEDPESENDRDNTNEASAGINLFDFYEPLSPSVIETAAALLSEMILTAPTSMALKDMSSTRGNLGSTHLATKYAASYRTQERYGKTDTSVCPPDVIVSLGTRACGSLVHAIAVHLNVPYSLSNWYPSGSIGDLVVDYCEGVGGPGYCYLNGLQKGMRVAVVLDCLKNGTSGSRLVKAAESIGCAVSGIYTFCEMVDHEGRLYLHKSLPHIPVHSLFRVSLHGERSHVMDMDTDIALLLDGTGNTSANGASYPLDCAPPLPLVPPPETMRFIPRKIPSSYLSIIRRMSPVEIQKKYRRVAASFVNIPISLNSTKSLYPYSFFPLTDFKPLLEPTILEDMADLCVYYGHFHRSDVLVSEGDRGGGPLVQAVSLRTQQPFVMASWTVSQGCGAAAFTNVGFSGSNSHLSLRGLPHASRVTFVDDMLSSGGTAEAVLDCVRQMGSEAVEAVFLSEKLYPSTGQKVSENENETRSLTSLPIRKGKMRLEKCFPHLTVTCVVQFIANGDITTEPPCRIGN